MVEALAVGLEFWGLGFRLCRAEPKGLSTQSIPKRLLKPKTKAGA